MALTERLALLVDAKVDGAVRDIKTLAKESGKADTHAKQLEARGKAIGTAWKVGVGVVAGIALKKFADLAGESVAAASDLSETTNKVSVVFGKSAGVIVNWGESAATALGLSKNQALDAASTFGSYYEAAGLAADAAAGMSMKTVQLAADMASFNNADPSDVLESIRSGLSGETEPLRKFNVFLNDNAVKAKAAALGFQAVNGQLTDGQKIQARYAIILDQTKKQQGDLARTSGSLANQQRFANAEMENAKAALGEGLLPAQLAVTKAFVEMAPTITTIAKVTGDAVEEFTKLPAPLQAVIGATAVMGGGFLLLAPRIAETKTALMELGIMSEREAVMASKMGTALRGASGIVGAAALTMNHLDESSDHATRTIGQFGNVAAGALLGFAAGGPIGAAIGGGIASVGALVSAFTKGDDAARKAAEGADQYRTTLDQLTGAVTGSTEALVAQRLEQQGVLADAEKLGISTNLLVSAILGQGRASDDLQAQLAALRSQYTGLSSDGDLSAVLGGQQVDLLAVTSAAADAQAKYAGLLPILNNVQGAFNLESSAVDQSTEAQKRVADASKGAAAGTDSLVRSTQGLVAVSKEERDALKKSIEAMREKRSEALRSANAEINYQASIDDARKSLKENGKTLDITTEKGRANKSALLDMASAWNDLSTKEKNSKGARADAIQQFVDLATKMGMSSDKARDLAQRLLEIPSKRVVKVEVDTGPAFAAIDSFINKESGRRITVGLGVNAPTARASGGPVSRGETYLVGEDGPELFTPRTSGTIISNTALGRSSGGTSSTGGGTGGSFQHLVTVSEKMAAAMLKATHAVEKHEQAELDAAQKIRDSIAARLQALRSDKASLSGSFGQAGGVFGSDATSIEGILKARSSQAQDALAENQGVAALIKKGVSESVLRELASSGQSGLAQIKALAGADPAQIAEFNKLTQIANANLAAAGGQIGSAVDDSDISRTQRQLRRANRNVRDERMDAHAVEVMAEMLGKALDKRDKNTTVELHIGSQVLLTTLLELKRKRRTKLGLD